MEGHAISISTRQQNGTGGAMRSETSCILAVNGDSSVGSASGRMSSAFAVSGVRLILVALHLAAYGQSPRAKITAPVRRAETGAPAGLSASLSQWPLSFAANPGQTDPQVGILSRGHGDWLFLSERGAVGAQQQRDSRSGKCWRSSGWPFGHIRRARGPAGALKGRPDTGAGNVFSRP
jgi:hypothetical protein